MSDLQKTIQKILESPQVVDTLERLSKVTIFTKRELLKMVSIYFNEQIFYNKTSTAVVSINFSEFCGLIPFVLGIVCYWWVFFGLTSIKQTGMTFFSVDTSVESTLKTYCVGSGALYIRINQLILFLVLMGSFTYHGPSLLLWNHIRLSGFLFFIVRSVICLHFFFLLLAKSSELSNSIKNTEYFFVLGNLSLFMPLIFLSNNLLTLFFFIELNSLFVFYHFVVSRFWFNETFNNRLGYHQTAVLSRRFISKSFINALFFQYWAMFFSSILLVFVICVFLFLFGTTEWAVLSFTGTLFSAQESYLNYAVLLVVGVCLFASFAIKLGLAPIYLYKIEVYNGLPYITILFYSIYYFIVYVLLFAVMIDVYFLFLYSIFPGLLLIVFVGGVYYSISLMFSVDKLKGFFAYSSVLHGLNIFSLICAMLV